MELEKLLNEVAVLVNENSHLLKRERAKSQALRVAMLLRQFLEEKDGQSLEQMVLAVQVFIGGLAMASILGCDIKTLEVIIQLALEREAND